MRAVGAYEAKVHLSQLLDRVAKGETITITRHGVPVAVLAPPSERKQADITAAIDKLRELRKQIKPLDGITIREMIEEGRRY